MHDKLENLDELGVKIPEISLPAAAIDIEKWAVVACDQWTQDRDYWHRVERSVENAPSTLNLIFPEVYLNDADADERIKSIHSAMRSYIKDEFSDNPILSPARKAGVFIERKTKHGLRRGFVLAIDLEKYDWKHSGKALIRSSEDTIEERLPPRVKIREGAPLETPHILLLIDDKENLLMSLFTKLLNKAPCVYKSDLMEGGGAVCGRLVYRKGDWAFIEDALRHLYRNSITTQGKDGAFLFAVGDGNHSLATAKLVWERYKSLHKKDAGIMEHRARFALVEVVNLYDEALCFEPIHRVMFGIKYDDLIAALRNSGKFSVTEVNSDINQLKRLVCEENTPKNRYAVISRDKLALLESEGGVAATVALEPVLRNLANTESGGVKLDYIHGEDELCRVSISGGDDVQAVGIMLPPFRKEGLFSTIARQGPLPRKSFSMGCAEEKRYYLECRKLFC